MPAKDFYSARLLYVILVDDGRPKKRNHYEESVVVFSAHTRDEAFGKALALGRKAETSYLNDRKQHVRWSLVEIVNLDLVRGKIDGAEVASHLHYRTSKKAISAKTKFHPERSKPEESF